MNFFNDLSQNIQTLWGKLAGPQRATLIAATVGVVAIVGLLLFWAVRSDMKTLGKYDAEDLEGVVSYLETSKIKYKANATGDTFYIPKDNVYRSRMDLAQQGIFSSKGTLTVGFEIFDRNNFGISDFAQRTNLVRAMQGELSRTITNIEGIYNTRVHIVVPENRLLLTDEGSRPKASVFIDTGSRQLPSEAVNSIRHLVSHSVEGVLANDVTIHDNMGNLLSQDLLSSGGGSLQSQLKLQENLENHYANKIESMLTRIVGPGNVVAKVGITLDTQASTFLEETFDPEGQVIRTQTSDKGKTKSTEGKAQDQGAGAAANIPQAQAATETSVLSSSEDTTESKTTSFEINRKLTEITQGPGEIKSISASVIIAPRGGEEAAPRTTEELSELRQLVINALGVDPILLQSSEDNLDGLVKVVERDFHQTEMGGVPTLVNDIMFTYGPMIKRTFYLIIAIILFIALLKVLKKFKNIDSGVEVMDGIDGAGQGKQLETQLTPELLNELIQEKPDNVSTALQSWASNNQSQSND